MSEKDKFSLGSEESILRKKRQSRLAKNIQKENTAIISETNNVNKKNDLLQNLKNKMPQPNIANALSNKQNKASKLMNTMNKIVKFIDSSIDYILDRKTSVKVSDVMKYTRGPAIFGMWVSAITLLIFLIWGVWAPLNSAASVEGQLVLESKKRILQHPTGGQIKKIHVRNGDQVKQGDILISLDKTAIQAKYDALSLRVLSLKAEHARLLAEANELDDLIFSDELLAHSDNPDIAIILKTQKKLFETRTSVFKGKIQAREEKIKQYKFKSSAFQRQLESVNKQIEITDEQIDSYRRLVKTGNAPKESLRRLENSMEELQAKKASVIAEISINNEVMIQDANDIQNEKSAYFAEVEKSIKDNLEQLNHIKGEENIIEDELTKLNIVAPINGQVSNLLQQTEEGVIHREHIVAEIVPNDDKLVFDARVKVDDIDVVRVGQKASIRISAFKSRVVPPIDGIVVSVSADVMQPRMQGEFPYYKARIEFDKKSLKDVTSIKGVELYPGMMGGGLIEIGNRTLLRYILDPITSTFEKAFIEQ